MQQQPKYMILTDRPTVWRLSFDYEEIYKIVSLRTSYDEDKTISEQGTDPTNSRIILDDDRPMFNLYLALAISDLTGLLARRIESGVQITADDGTPIDNQGMVETSDSITYYLVMSLNHEAHLLMSLYRYCQEYLARRVLEQWYGNTSANSEEMRLKIYQVLEYRKKPVTRPIRGLF